MKTKLFILILLLSCLYSCTDEEKMNSTLIIPNSTKESVILLKERDSKYPLDFPKRNVKTRNLKLASENNGYLGYSYKLDNFPLGTAINLGNPIIKIDEIRKQEDFYVHDYNIGSQSMVAFSYSTFDRYTFKSKDTKKVTSGFNLDIKLFSLGNKNTIEEVFTKDVANERNRVYGQLDVELLGKRHKLTTSSNFIKKIKIKYLHPIFIEEINSLSMDEFINTYGAFVLVDFYTGGRLTALYSGIYNSNDITETKEKNIDIDINASYGNKKDTIGASGSVGIGRGYYREESTSQKINGMKLSIKAIGGNLNYAAFSAPQNITNIDIDLSKWMASLTPDTYSMIDIADEGLIPLSELVSEVNYNNALRQYMSTGHTNLAKHLIEPNIEIMRRKIQGITLVYSFLISKTDTRVLLTVDNMTGKTETEIQNKIQNIFNTNKDVFGLKTYLKTLDNDTIPLAPKFTADFCGDLHQLKKYIDHENNTMYLLYYPANKKNSANLSAIENMLFGRRSKSNCSSYNSSATFCFSLFNYKKTLNLYGLTDFVKELPEVIINKEDLQDFVIFGL